MNLRMIPCVLALAFGIGCGSTTIECSSQEDCTAVDSRLACNIPDGKTKGWCDPRPSTCTEDFQKLVCDPLGASCVEKDGSATCGGGMSMKTCANTTCAAGESCVEIAGTVACLETCTEDSACAPKGKFCGPHPNVTNVKVCLPKLPNGQRCDRVAMCQSANCPATSDPTKQVCTTQPSTVCTSDGNGSCTWAAEFCNTSMTCETKHNPNEICSRPAMCKSNVCGNDGRCGCTTTNDCTSAGLNGFICDGTNHCVVDPGQANVDYVKICMTCNDPAGCRGYVFDNSAATFSSSPDFVAKGAETCVTLKYGVCSTFSVPLTSASYGPGSSSTMSYALPADKRLPGVQLQVCDKATVTSDCFAGIERGTGFMFPNMVSAVKIVGLGSNPLVAKGPQSYNSVTEIYVQKDGTTSRDGNPYVGLAKLGCPQ